MMRMPAPWQVAIESCTPGRGGSMSDGGGGRAARGAVATHTRVDGLGHRGHVLSGSSNLVAFLEVSFSENAQNAVLACGRQFFGSTKIAFLKKKKKIGEASNGCSASMGHMRHPGTRPAKQN